MSGQTGQRWDKWIALFRPDLLQRSTLHSALCLWCITARAAAKCLKGVGTQSSFQFNNHLKTWNTIYKHDTNIVSQLNRFTHHIHTPNLRKQSEMQRNEELRVTITHLPTRCPCRPRTAPLEYLKTLLGFFRGSSVVWWGHFKNGLCIIL